MSKINVSISENEAGKQKLRRCVPSKEKSWIEDEEFIVTMPNSEAQNKADFGHYPSRLGTDADVRAARS